MTSATASATAGRDDRITADPRTPDDGTLTTVCMSVFVVPGEGGVALAVPAWTPHTAEDERLRDHARQIIRLREAIVPISPSISLEP